MQQAGISIQTNDLTVYLVTAVTSRGIQLFYMNVFTLRPKLLSADITDKLIWNQSGQNDKSTQTSLLLD